MLIIYFLLFLAVLLAFSSELASFMVYGSFSDEEELGKYLDKYLSTSYLNPYDKDIFGGMPHYIARHNTILSKWHVKDFGQIPRWSLSSKVLDDAQKELLKTYKPENFGKKLSDL